MKTLTLICVAFAISCRATVLNFDLPAVAPGDQDSYGPGSEYLEAGFRITLTSVGGGYGSIIRFNPIGVSVLPNDGTPHFGATYYANPQLDRPDGALFSFTQLDLAHYSQFVVTNEISLRGNKADGTAVNALLTLPSSFDPTFHTFQLDASWTDLRSVTFLTEGFAWDNFAVTVVPEPSSGFLGCLGIFLLRAYRRRNAERPSCVARNDRAEPQRAANRMEPLY